MEKSFDLKVQNNGSGSPPIQKPPISSGFYLDEGHVADKKSNGKEQATSKVIYFSFSTSQLTTPRPPFQLRLWLRSIQRWRRNQGGQKASCQNKSTVVIKPRSSKPAINPTRIFLTNTKQNPVKKKKKKKNFTKHSWCTEREIGKAIFGILMSLHVATFSIAKPSTALDVLLLIGCFGSGMLKLLLFVFFVPLFDDWMIIFVNLHLFSPFSPFLRALVNSFSIISVGSWNDVPPAC
jgi:hypothetical protein